MAVKKKKETKINNVLCYVTHVSLLESTGMDRTMGQRENLRWRKDLTQWRQTNDRHDK